MPFIGNQPALSYTSFAKQDFTTSATTSYTLDHSVANENEIALFINFVRQEPTTAYTASGTTLTLTSATSATDDMYCVFLGKAVQTVNPPAGSVDSSKINYPLTTFSSTGIDDNASSTAVTIDSSGNVGIGTSSIDTNAAVQIENGESYLVMKDAQQMGIKLYGDDTNVIYSYDKTADSLTGGITFGHSDGTTIFYTGGINERMRIDNVGNLKASRNGVAFNVNSCHQFVDNLANSYSLQISNKASVPAYQYMLEIGFKNSSPDNSSAQFIEMLDATTVRCKIESDGDIYNHNGVYGTISDERIKQNIVDAGSQWNDIKNIKIRKYKKKDDVLQYGEENAPIELGVISQELETVSPGLVKEEKPNSSHVELHEDFAGENPQNVKYVKYSVLYMKSIKALQEAMARIEQLETKNTELEARITALENA